MSYSYNVGAGSLDAARNDAMDDEESGEKSLSGGESAAQARHGGGLI